MKRLLASLGSLLLMAGAFAPQASAQGTSFTGSEKATIVGVESGVDYTFTANADGTLSIEWSYINGAQVPGLVGHQIYYPATNAFWNGTQTEPFHYTYTTTETFAAGDNLHLVFWVARAGGLDQIPVEYVYGSTNAPVETGITLTATVSDITANSAKINWQVTPSPDLADATIEVFFNGITIKSNPMDYTGLTGNKEYTCSMRATATLDGKKYDSNVVELKFKTLDPDAKDLVLVGSATGVAANVVEVGDVNYKVDYTITYTTDKKVVITAKYTSEKNITGMVPQIFTNNAYSGNMALEGDTYTYTLPGTYEKGQELPIGLFIAYAGGSSMTDVAYTTGSEGTSVGVAAIADGAETFSVYTISGVCVLKNATAADLKALAPGLYIANGKKIRL